MTDETNITRGLFSISGGKEGIPGGIAPAKIPQNTYLIVDTDGMEHFADGFLIFTSQHIAVMRDSSEGAMPVLVMPLTNVKFAELFEDDSDEEELPF